MAIEKEYMDLIEEIKQNDDQLNPWEKGFIYGDGESTPIAERGSLSISQKNTVEKIYKERVQGVDRSVTQNEVQFKNKRVRATKLETNAYSVLIDEGQVGPDVSYKEAVAIVGWLDEVVDQLMPANESADESFPGE